MTQPEPMETMETRPAPGERLRQAREARKLTCADVAAQLRLGVGKIEAMERGEVAGIVAPVYLSGYLRAYARMVGLPAEEIIGEFGALVDLAPPIIDPVPAVSAKGYGKFPTEFSLAGGKGWQAVLRWGAVSLVLMAVAGAWWKLREEKRQSPSTVVAETPAIPSKGQMPEDVTGEQTDAAAVPDEATSVLGDIPAPDREPLAPRSQLAITLVEESWVEIVDAQGNRLMHELARAGRSYTLTGVAPFEIMLGFAAGVRLEYNGTPYDLSRYQGRRTAKFTLGAMGDRMNID